MNYAPLTPLAWWAVGIPAFVLLLKWMQRRGWIDANPDRVRRGTGHAMMGLQEFIQPSVQHVIKAEQAEPREDAQGDKP